MFAADERFSQRRIRHSDVESSAKRILYASIMHQCQACCHYASCLFWFPVCAIPAVPADIGLCRLVAAICNYVCHLDGELLPVSPFGYDESCQRDDNVNDAWCSWHLTCYISAVLLGDASCRSVAPWCAPFEDISSWTTNGLESSAREYNVKEDQYAGLCVALYAFTPSIWLHGASGVSTARDDKL